MLSPDVLCRCFDAFSHDPLYRPKRYDTAGPFGRLHFKMQDTTVVSLNSQTNDFAH